MSAESGEVITSVSMDACEDTLILKSWEGRLHLHKALGTEGGLHPHSAVSLITEFNAISCPILSGCWLHVPNKLMDLEKLCSGPLPCDSIMLLSDGWDTKPTSRTVITKGLDLSR